MRTLRENIFLFLKGMGMGAADVIPGVSGGTIAFITGIYEELIFSIKEIDLDALKLVFAGKIISFWKKINGSFLLVLFSGIFVSLLSLAKLILFFMDNNPISLWSFFFGLILVSAIIVSREVKKITPVTIITGIVGIAIAYLITTATPAETPESLWFVFIAGCIAICAMILPGISGSFILLLLAKYQFIMQSVSNFNIPVLIVFAMGCIVGLLSFARVISWVFKNYHDLAVALLSGFMIGSLNKIWPWKVVVGFRINSDGEQVPAFTNSVSPKIFYETTGNDPEIINAVVFAALGILLVFGLEKLADYFKRTT